MKIRAITQSLSAAWAISPEAAEVYLPLVASFIKGNFQPFTSEGKSKEDSRIGVIGCGIPGAYFISTYGEAAPPEAAPENSVAIISMQDVITKYDQACGDSGTVTKADILLRADKNPNIKAHILLMDTPGGEAYAAMAMAEVVKSVSKPTVAFIDDLSASAGMMIASQANYIVANQELARVGSIGTFLTLADYKGYFEKEGIKIIEVYADASTDKNKPYRDAIDKGEFKLIKQDLNAINDRFLKMVESGRADKLKSGREEWGTGKVFFARDAVKIGLIDEIMPLENVIKSLLNS
jgi:signal peptide peptidase SppA